VLSVISAGGRASAYQEGGYNRYTIRQLLAPVEQTVRLCGIDYLPPYVIHGTHRLSIDDIEREAERYERVLRYLSESADDLAELAGAEYANDYLTKKALEGATQ